MGKHTPGPWAYEVEQLDAKGLPWAFEVYEDTTGRNFLLATVVQQWTHDADPDDVDAATTEANARLIAAAPDLLEGLRQTAAALEQIATNRAYKAGMGAGEWESFVYDCERHALDAAHAAIAKAEGRA